MQASHRFEPILKRRYPVARWRRPVRPHVCFNVGPGIRSGIRSDVLDRVTPRIRLGIGTRHRVGVGVGVAAIDPDVSLDVGRGVEVHVWGVRFAAGIDAHGARVGATRAE